MDRATLTKLAQQFGLNLEDVLDEACDAVAAADVDDAELKRRIEQRLRSNTWGRMGTRQVVEEFLDATFGADAWGLYELPDQAMLLIVVRDDTMAANVARTYDELPSFLPVGVVFKVVVKPPDQAAAISAANRMGGSAAALVVLKELE